MANWSGLSFGGFDPILSYAAELPYMDAISAQNFGWNKKMAKFNADLQKDLAQYQYGLNLQSYKDAPAAQREGLEAAGYNPILAVNSAAGQSFGNSIPGVSGSSMSPPHVGIETKAGGLDLLGKAALIRQTNAQTDLIHKRSAAEGWQVKTLSASEARGLGASFARTLGLHFNGSDSQTFLIAYNVITGEMRNVTSTRDLDALGSTGEQTSADHPSVSVDDGINQLIHYYADPQSDKPTSYHNLPR